MVLLDFIHLSAKNAREIENHFPKETTINKAYTPFCG